MGVPPRRDGRRLGVRTDEGHETGGGRGFAPLPQSGSVQTKTPGRTFTEAEREEVATSVLKAKRYTFIESGVTHPNFQLVFTEVNSEAHCEKVGAAPEALLG